MNDRMITTIYFKIINSIKATVFIAILSEW